MAILLLTTQHTTFGHLVVLPDTDQFILQLIVYTNIAMEGAKEVN